MNIDELWWTYCKEKVMPARDDSNRWVTEMTIIFATILFFLPALWLWRWVF